MPKRLIVNADDFGYTSGINRAIIRSCRHGVVTSATLMAGAQAFTGAVSLAREHALSVGCHVVIVDGDPLCPAQDLPTLAPQGHFRSSATQIALDALCNRIAPQEVEAEAFAQFSRLINAGIQPTHFDSHKHTHLFPSLLRPMLRAANRAGIFNVRNPFEPDWSLSWRRRFSGKRSVRTLETALLRTFRKTFTRAVQAAGLKTPDGAIGVITTGTLDNSLLCHMLDRMPAGTWELVCHPGVNDRELQQQHTRLRASREIELDVLTSPLVQEAITRNGIDLISFAGL